MVTMIQINDIDAALTLFQESASRHADATQTGDYKICNKCYKSITAAIAFLKGHDALLRLEAFLRHPSVGVRMWAATYLLPIREDAGVKALEEISAVEGIHALTAMLTLSEWKKGNLKT